MVEYKHPKREINRVFLHCSASSRPEHGNIETITEWHRARGFSGIGYHYLIPFSGELLVGRDLEIAPAAQKGHNTGTIAICVHGLVHTDFKMQQIQTLEKLCKLIVAADPKITIHGHCEVSAKLCPVFDYVKALKLDSQGHMPPDKPEFHTLDMFDVGPEVYKLQQRLNIFFRSTDFPIAPIHLEYQVSVDGIFGQQTAQALIQFQMIRGLDVTGVLDRKTNLMLPNLPAE